MWKNNSSIGGGDNNNNNNKDDDKEKTMAKTAGFVVFSGIAMSILKTLNPFNNTLRTTTTSESTSGAQLTESSQPYSPPPPPPTTILHCHTSLPSQEPPINKKSSSCLEKTAVVESSPSEPLPRTIEIVKGDTLWGLSRKYGVSIEAIKEANGLTGDTIYTGKKLKIP